MSTEHNTYISRLTKYLKWNHFFEFGNKKRHIMLVMPEHGLFSAEKEIFEGSEKGRNFTLNWGWNNARHILAWAQFPRKIIYFVSIHTICDVMNSLNK